nr:MULTISPECIES: hypothetical protein [Vibrio]
MVVTVLCGKLVVALSAP